MPYYGDIEKVGGDLRDRRDLNVVESRVCWF